MGTKTLSQIVKSYESQSGNHETVKGQGRRGERRLSRSKNCDFPLQWNCFVIFPFLSLFLKASPKIV